mmetsp:Transcript_8416/g.15377  ORF Transcript_8416/g.15377 Transcript_8416/m.15377 type:complete len:397 (-) Transcript_8416:83-1273(-)
MCRRWSFLHFATMRFSTATATFCGIAIVAIMLHGCEEDESITDGTGPVAFQCCCMCDSPDTCGNTSEASECSDRPGVNNLTGWSDQIEEACANLSTSGCTCSGWDSSLPCGVVVGRLYSTSKGVCQARVVPEAKASAESDWTGQKEEAAPENTKDQGLAAHFLSVGLSEHASVASFSRVVLELMQLGAPAGLVNRTLVAAQEEIRHAQMAFSLAKTWSSQAFALSPLEGLEFRPITLEEFADQTVREAVEGETPAALKAALALRFAQHGGVRDFLAAVAVEERRHAELAWATLAWAFLQESPAVQQSASASLDRTVAHLKTQPASQQGDLAHGLLTPELEEMARHEAAGVVVKLQKELKGATSLDDFESRAQRHFDDALASLRSRDLAGLDVTVRV